MSFSKSYGKLSVSIFGNVAERYQKYFINLEPQLLVSGMRFLLKVWISLMLFTSFLVYVSLLGFIIIFGILSGIGIFTIIFMVILVPVVGGGFTFMLFYIYPIQGRGKVKKDIDLNLPFALTHMAALSSAGLAPENMFEMMTGFGEYGEISKQAKVIVRDIKMFGMSSVEAIKDISKRTPSQTFKQILVGLHTTIEKGGNTTKYLNEVADEALNDYKVKRESYMKTLSTYADIYTAILVAAPLMFLAVLGIMGIIGGDVFGFSVEELIYLLTFIVLPVLNLGFLGFIELTHPGV
ncbi:MAG: type II secretion system F family protein [Candidatus Aenigmarchaeota archaeon]|nr:type II secretion system F family protein [Candidatus Aenigmarchaeota archaeon]